MTSCESVRVSDVMSVRESVMTSCESVRVSDVMPVRLPVMTSWMPVCEAEAEIGDGGRREPTARPPVYHSIYTLVNKPYVIILDYNPISGSEKKR